MSAKIRLMLEKDSRGSVKVTLSGLDIVGIVGRGGTTKEAMEHLVDQLMELVRLVEGNR